MSQVFRETLYEGKSFRMAGHKGLAPENPDVAQVGDVFALLLKCLQIFLCDSPGRCSNRPTAERCTLNPCSVASSAVNASMVRSEVRSGCVVIRP